ncbi:calpain family cysteine protease [Whalleya microplaca]|nr:calpain family cysteine protease [Whalleya microplaca]
MESSSNYLRRPLDTDTTTPQQKKTHAAIPQHMTLPQLLLYKASISKHLPILFCLCNHVLVTTLCNCEFLIVKMAEPIPPVPPNSDVKKWSKKTPQETLADFWDKFHSKHPGKVTSIFPRSLYRSVFPPINLRGARSARNAAESYEAAAKDCRDKVKRIVRECHRTNEKFTDPDFDIERDPDHNCLYGLIRDSYGAGDTVASRPQVTAWDVKNSLDTLAQSNMLGNNGTVPMDLGELGKFIGSDGPSATDVGEWCSGPGSVHRVDWIFESPQFTIGGYSSSDIKQGVAGDCWWLAAVATIAHRKDLMDRVCVARDEECGVYGFVFQRDGEWISTVVDDNLYLTSRDFDFYSDVYDSTGRKARRYRMRKQTGSEALYFAHCEDPNETWLPILEKAYAKVHGDYDATDSGWPGEAVEDMTGGVTSTVAANRVLNKDRLWKELVNTDGEFVFALAAMETGLDWKKNGIALGHAYSILQSREEVDEDGTKIRLVQVRNPWGERTDNGVGEWNGPWSDGSKEWTPYWQKKLNHTFGDDGVFWISYRDMLNTFMYIHRTRLFDEKWTIIQQWTSANISWVTGYLQTKFQIEVKRAGLAVIVLTQLDERYFKSFEGEYYFELHFILQELDAPTSEHICRVRPVHKWENRSVSCEVELDPGKYEVLPQITATRHSTGSKPVEDIVKEYADKNPQKLRQIGMNFDQAHAKGGVTDEDELLEKKRAEDKRKKQEKKRKKKAKEKKEIAKAAKAVGQAADAMKKAVEDGSAKTGGAKDNKEEGKIEKKEDSDTKSETKEAAEKTSTADQGDSQKPTIESRPGTAKDSLPMKDTGSSQRQENSSNQPGKSTEAPDLPSAANVITEKLESTGEQGEGKEEEKKEDEDDEDEDEDEESESEKSDEGDKLNLNSPWNAVCVLGLRVYARDPELTITLVKAKEGKEATALTVDGQPAGATM